MSHKIAKLARKNLKHMTKDVVYVETNKRVKTVNGVGYETSTIKHKKGTYRNRVRGIIRHGKILV